MLTAKQHRFVDEYLIDLNGAAAATRAGYAEKYANDQAAQLLAKPEIVARIDELKLARSERTSVSADWLLRRLADEAEACITDLYDESGALLPVHSWPEIWGKGLVTTVETLVKKDDDGNVIGHVERIRFSDRVRRLELIGRHTAVQAWRDQIEVKGLDGLADRLSRAANRLDDEMPATGQAKPESQPRATASDPGAHSKSAATDICAVDADKPADVERAASRDPSAGPSQIAPEHTIGRRKDYLPPVEKPAKPVYRPILPPIDDDYSPFT